MDSLRAAVGVTDESIERARIALGQQMRREGQAFVDEGARRTMALPGYRHLDIEAVRPNTARSFASILDTLESGDFTRFGGLLGEIAYQRAKQGLPPTSFYDLADITEAMLNELAGRCLEGPVALLSAAIVARRIADGTRAVIIDNFQRAHLEIRAEVERLASQFSAPILPALPGVLVMPIVGAVSPARAEQIVDTLLAGIERDATRVAILDITGVVEVDATLPALLRRATAAAALLGTRVVLVGVSARVALVLVAGQVELDGVDIYPTLATALLAVARRDR